MKRCPDCRRDYTDETLNFCLDDGARLVDGPSTAELVSEAQTRNLINATDQTAYLPAGIGARRIGRTKKVWLLTGIVVALIAGGFFGYRYLTTTSTSAITSIAVMPFINESNDPETEYLSQGLAESLIYRLSQVPNLRVSPTSSVFRYKGKDVDPLQLGQELGVNTVLVGRINQRGDALVISAELVDVRSNKSLWGEQYDRKISDLLATQREIAREIAERLKVQVSGERGLTKNYTTSNEAYLLHLQGRFLIDKRTKPELECAIQAFRKAIELDPNFALAYVGLADAYNAMLPYGYMTAKDAFAEARVAAKRAIEIDPSLAEAHSAYGVVLAAYDWNWAEAEREHLKAIELSPNREGPYFYYATGYLMFVGRNDEAVTALRHAIEIEPKSLNSNARLGTVLGYTRQYDLALEQARKAYDLDPTFLGARAGLIESLVRKGLYDEAIKLGEETLIMFPDQEQIIAALGYAYAKAGNKDEARKILADAKTRSMTKFVLSARIARISIALGDMDEAFSWLEKGFKDRDWFLLLIRSDPAYDEIRNDPRFVDLVKRIGYPN